MSSSSRAARSRHSSIAISVLAVAALLVAVAAVVGSAALLVAAGIAAVLAGATTFYVMRAHLIETRRSAQTNRTRLAREYADLAARLSSDHSRDMDHMSAQVETRDRSIESMQETLSAAQARADALAADFDLEHQRLKETSAVAAAAQSRVGELVRRFREIERQLAKVEDERDISLEELRLVRSQLDEELTKQMH